jgi:2-dehydro-3-deoxygluconokinase
MCAAWADEGIDLSLVRRLPGRLPGLYCIQTDAHGERRFLYWRNEAAVRECFTNATAAQVLTALDDYSVFYLSGITLAVLGENGLDRLLPRLIAARARGAKLVFDNNYRPRLWRDRQHAADTYRRLLPHLDLALLTLDDEQALFEEADIESIFNRYQQMGVNEVVIKRGAQSCLVQYDGALHEVAATKVAKVIDTTAAGDSFSAGYLATRLHGGTPQHAAAEGHRLAGQVIQYPGALIAREVMPG